MIVLIFIFPIIETNLFIKCLILLTIFSFNAFCFYFQNHNKIDRFIGELSYPIYILHISLIIFTSYIVDYFSISFSITVLSFLLTILVSVIINFIITKPINKFRIKFKNL